jgi:hypothetical protein
MYLDCPPNMGWSCPNATEVVAFREAVQRGDIWWHAYPHNAQMEVMDESLLTYGVTMTHELDALFGLPPKITLSQVPANLWLYIFSWVVPPLPPFPPRQRYRGSSKCCNQSILSFAQMHTCLAINSLWSYWRYPFHPSVSMLGILACDFTLCSCASVWPQPLEHKYPPSSLPLSFHLLPLPTPLMAWGGPRGAEGRAGNV